MDAKPRYSGLCETCDHGAVCKMERSHRLEIIHCEQYSTRPAPATPAKIREEKPMSIPRPPSFGWQRE